MVVIQAFDLICQNNPSNLVALWNYNFKRITLDLAGYGAKYSQPDFLIIN